MFYSNQNILGAIWILGTITFHYPTQTNTHIRLCGLVRGFCRISKMKVTTFQNMVFRFSLNAPWFMRNTHIRREL